MKIVGYIAASIDGYIADQNKELDWLTPFENIDYGKHSYPQFIETIDTVVMGRATYQWIRNKVTEWPYADKKSLIVTSNPLTDLPKNVSSWTGGIDALLTQITEHKGKNIWICGGGKLQSAIIERNAMDHLQIFVMPIVLGAGVRLWPGAEKQTHLLLNSVEHLEKGVIHMAYDRNNPST